MKKFSKEYQVWEWSDGGYQLTEFDTLEEAVLSQKYTDNWYVTKAFGMYESCKVINLEKKVDLDV